MIVKFVIKEPTRKEYVIKTHDRKDEEHIYMYK